MLRTSTLAGFVFAGVVACIGAAEEKPAGTEKRGGAASGQEE